MENRIGEVARLRKRCLGGRCQQRQTWLLLRGRRSTPERRARRALDILSSELAPVLFESGGAVADLREACVTMRRCLRLSPHLIAVGFATLSASPAAALPKLVLVSALRMSIWSMSTLQSRRIDFAVHDLDGSASTHFDLQDAVKHSLGGRVTFYFGSNLASGDASGAKIFGLKFYFD